MKTWRYSSTILDLDSRWYVSGQLHALAALPQRKIAPDTQWIRDRADPSFGLEPAEERNISCSCQELNPGHPARRNIDRALSTINIFSRV
jgi:hypothetical protein